MESIYDYEQRLFRYRKTIKALRNGDLALRFLDHMGVQGLSLARVSKYSSHMPMFLKNKDFDLKDAKREDIERMVVWINSQRCNLLFTL